MVPWLTYAIVSLVPVAIAIANDVYKFPIFVHCRPREVSIAWIKK